MPCYFAYCNTAKQLIQPAKAWPIEIGRSPDSCKGHWHIKVLKTIITSYMFCLNNIHISISLSQPPQQEIYFILELQ